MDEQMIADMREWVVLPCTDRTGKHIASWDICTNQPEPDAIGVGVVASVYSGEATARAILAAVQAHSVMAGKVAELEEIARTANELVNGGGLRTVAYADTPKLCVVEKADKSDPHYRLCTLLERAALAPHPKGME